MDGGCGRRSVPHTRGASEGGPTHAPGAENLRRAIAGVAPREEADDEDSQDGHQVRSKPFGTANPEKARSERGTAFRCTPDLDRGGPRAERQLRTRRHACAPRAPRIPRDRASERHRAPPTSYEE
jgi:hypothetical protein